MPWGGEERRLPLQCQRHRSSERRRGWCRRHGAVEVADHFQNEGGVSASAIVAVDAAEEAETVRRAPGVGAASRPS
jgi:hypothetical protein